VRSWNRELFDDNVEGQVNRRRIDTVSFFGENFEGTVETWVEMNQLNRANSDLLLKGLHHQRYLTRAKAEGKTAA